MNPAEIATLLSEPLIERTERAVTEVLGNASAHCLERNTVTRFLLWD